MKYIAAIDWGSGSATVAVGNRDMGGRLRILGIATRPMKEGVVAGEITNIEELTTATRSAIDELEQRLGITVEEAYASISGQELSCTEQTYFVPVGGNGNVIRAEDVAKLHDLMNTMTAPNNNICIFDRIPQIYLIDSREQTRQPVGRFGRRLDTTYKFVYGSNDNVARLRLAFDRLGIKLLGIFTAPQASAASVLSQDERELGSAVVDLGAMTTEIAIWHDNIMRHVCVIPLGSAAIDRDMRSAAMPTNWIEKLKIKYGYAAPQLIDADFAGSEVKVPGATPKYDKMVSFEVLAQIIEARLTDIIEAVMAELRESGYATRLGSGLVLTGGGSNLKKIDELFRLKLRIDVRTGGIDPMLVSEGTDEKYLKPEFATAVGALLLGLEKSDLEASSDKDAFTPDPPKPDIVTPDPPVEPETPVYVETSRERREREKREARERKEAERQLKEQEKKIKQSDTNAPAPPKQSGFNLTHLIFKRNIDSEGDSIVE